MKLAGRLVKRPEALSQLSIQWALQQQYCQSSSENAGTACTDLFGALVPTFTLSELNEIWKTKFSFEISRPQFSYA
jgi:hypothetical protein